MLGVFRALVMIFSLLSLLGCDPQRISELDVRKLLGKPMKRTPYPLKNEIAWDWRYLEPPNTSMIFSVWFGPEYRVLRTSTMLDPDPAVNGGSR
jgi:hypothetical protein